MAGKKEVRKSENSGQRTGHLKFQNFVGYAMGDMAGVITFGTIGSFLQMFYTDVLHISLGKIAVLMMIARIWDAVNDPMCGAILDHRKPGKGGRFRPVVFWFSLPLAIAFLLCFVRIPGLSENQYLIYAYITYIAYGMLYTAVNIPYGSMASAMTDDFRERSTLSVIRSLGAGLGSAPGQILLPLFVYSEVAGTGARYLDAGKLQTGVIILAGFSVIIYVGFYRLTKGTEHITPQTSEETNGLVTSFLHLVRSRAFITLCLASMLLISGSMYTQSVFNYLFKNYFGKPGLFSMVTVCTYLPMLILMPLMGKLSDKFGKKGICQFGAVFAAAAFLILFFLHTHNAYLFLAVILISGFGLSFFTLEVWAMVSDVIDYHQIVNGKRSEGTTYASFSFFRKLGQTLAGVGASLALAAIGYETEGEVITQTDAVNEGIYNIATLVPFAMYLAMYVLLKLYPLTREKVRDIHGTLHS